jgi:hypothetical protein
MDLLEREILTVRRKEEKTYNMLQLFLSHISAFGGPLHTLYLFLHFRGRVCELEIVIHISLNPLTPEMNHSYYDKTDVPAHQRAYNIIEIFVALVQYFGQSTMKKNGHEIDKDMRNHVPNWNRWPVSQPQRVAYCAFLLRRVW